MNIYVKKADGSRQLFDREKIVRTCLRMGANRHIAEEVADKIETGIYDGIETEKILKKIFRLLSRYQPILKHLADLRKGLSLMNPKPEFERYVQIVLSQNGYEVTPSQIIRGRCVEHEVDAIARKDGTTCFVEVKHHYNYHTPTGLDESRIARAVLEDVTEGFELGLSNLKMDGAMIVCNTKYSDHARRYGECRGILQIGWSSPPYHGLQEMIEEKKLHPITCLKDLTKETREKLTSAGIILIKQLVEEDPEEIARRAGMPYGSVESIIEKAKACTSTLSHRED
jgi:hypothetical protein